MKKTLLILGVAIIIAVIIILTYDMVAISAPASSKLEKIIEAVIPPQLEPATTTPISVKLMFGGDVMLSRVVNQKTIKSGNWAWPFQKIASTTAQADLFIINLESPFTIGGNHLVKTGSFSFNADPLSIAGLKLAGVDAVSLANNHTINQGKRGIADTQKLLTENSINFAGAGLNEAEAHAPIIKEISGTKIGMLAYAYPDDYSVASANTAGLAGMNINKMQQDVQNLKSQVDVVIVMMHAGIEYTNKPNSQQTIFAHKAIDAGADLVIGHHPHWVQTTEIYQGKPILYSLGNLVFDQMWSPETQEGALAQVELTDKKITEIKIIPIVIRDYGQASIADDIGKDRILKRMGLKSELIDLE